MFICLDIKEKILEYLQGKNAINFENISTLRCSNWNILCERDYGNQAYYIMKNYDKLRENDMKNIKDTNYRIPKYLYYKLKLKQINDKEINQKNFIENIYWKIMKRWSSKSERYVSSALEDFLEYPDILMKLKNYYEILLNNSDFSNYDDDHRIRIVVNTKKNYLLRKVSPQLCQFNWLQHLDDMIYISTNPFMKYYLYTCCDFCISVYSIDYNHITRGIKPFFWLQQNRKFWNKFTPIYLSRFHYFSHFTHLFPLFSYPHNFFHKKKYVETLAFLCIDESQLSYILNNITLINSQFPDFSICSFSALFNTVIDFLDTSSISIR